VSRAPPPIQITANRTWTVLNTKYQSDDQRKMTATARNASPMSAVGARDARPGAWTVDASTLTDGA
jgi:hypothetical protein